MTLEYHQIPRNFYSASSSLVDPWLLSASNSHYNLSQWNKHKPINLNARTAAQIPSLFDDEYEQDLDTWISPSTSPPPRNIAFLSTTAKVDPWTVTRMDTLKKSDEIDAEEDDEANMPSLYKTELCRSFMETGTCRYGQKCQFAHGRGEQRPVHRHPKYKTEICKTFHTLGTCPYGTRCRFIHTRSCDNSTETSPSNSRPTTPCFSRSSSPIAFETSPPMSLSTSPVLPARQSSWTTSWVPEQRVQGFSLPQDQDEEDAMVPDSDSPNSVHRRRLPIFQKLC